MVILLVSLAALAGIGVGMAINEHRWKHQLRLIVAGFKFGVVRRCPVCKQPVGPDCYARASGESGQDVRR